MKTDLILHVEMSCATKSVIFPLLRVEYRSRSPVVAGDITIGSNNLMMMIACVYLQVSNQPYLTILWSNSVANYLESKGWDVHKFLHKKYQHYGLVTHCGLLPADILSHIWVLRPHHVRCQSYMCHRQQLGVGSSLI